MPKASEVVELLRWRALELDRLLRLEDLSVEGLRYDQVPNELAEALTKFRRFNMWDRQRVVDAFNKAERGRTNSRFRISDEPVLVEILGEPRTSQDGRAEILVGVNGKLLIWQFGRQVYDQLRRIHDMDGFDKDEFLLEVRRTGGVGSSTGLFPRIEVLAVRRGE